jgi:hypothetical protein
MFVNSTEVKQKANIQWSKKNYNMQWQIYAEDNKRFGLITPRDIFDLYIASLINMNLDGNFLASCFLVFHQGMVETNVLTKYFMLKFSRTSSTKTNVISKLIYLK